MDSLSLNAQIMMIKGFNSKEWVFSIKENWKADLLFAQTEKDGDTRSPRCKMGDQKITATQLSSGLMATRSQYTKRLKLRDGKDSQYRQTKRGEKMDKESSGNMMVPYTLENTKMRTRPKEESISCNLITLTGNSK